MGKFEKISNAVARDVEEPDARMHSIHSFEIPKYFSYIIA